jgi:predicted nuclease of predicted toxin-antitoxin system
VPQPEFLADRCLGKRVVNILQSAQLTVHTLTDLFGEKRAQEMSDEDWIAHAGQRRYAVLTKDQRIRHRTMERDAVAKHGVHLFALGSGNLGFREMAGAFLTGSARMIEIVAQEPPGGIWVVGRHVDVVKRFP